MRLIDADALIAQMEADAEQMGDPIARIFTYAAIADMELAPTVDAVPVIRCKDCTYFREYDDGCYDCDNLYGIADVHKGCFCSRAERRKDNG